MCLYVKVVVDMSSVMFSKKYETKYTFILNLAMKVDVDMLHLTMAQILKLLMKTAQRYCF